MDVSSMTSKGQVTIPAHIRKALGLKVGDKVAFELDDNAVKLTPVLDDVTLAFGLLKSDKAVATEDIDQVAEAMIAQRYKKTA